MSDVQFSQTVSIILSIRAEVEPEPPLFLPPEAPPSAPTVQRAKRPVAIVSCGCALLVDLDDPELTPEIIRCYRHALADSCPRAAPTL